VTKKKAKKELDRETLARLKKEMAQPHLAHSVREQGKTGGRS
jgi:hypothetical protein